MIEGRIFIKQDRLYIDAEPYVMSKIRKLFDNSRNEWEQGAYTHKVMSFPINNSSCRDLDWIMSRYTLEAEREVVDLIKEKSKDYENIKRRIQQSHLDGNLKLSNEALVPSISLRDHQIKFLNMFNAVNGRLLLADKLGLGKTFSALSVLSEPKNRPAIIVVPTHLCTQWEREVNRIFPTLSTHVIKGFKNYPIPEVDVLITSYNRLAPWQDVLIKEGKFNTLILDEIQEVRRSDSQKSELCKKLTKHVKNCIGLSGTPIINYGNEIFSIMEVIKPGSLGTQMDFESEWCSWGKVNEPAILNKFLLNQGLMLRRTPEDIGLKFGKASKHVYTIDSDLKELEKIQNIAKMLAISVLSGNINESSESARELDWKLRHATGVAKARPSAEFVKMLLEQEEKVVLVGWHRDVYDIWMKELAAFNPKMYTGSESPKEKDEAVKAFIEGDARVFIISLRSGAGLDGLQRICNNIVFGELDWSGNMMDQVVGRLERDGQTKHVNAYYLTIADGADPFMLKVLNLKRSQHDGLIEGKQGDVVIAENKDDNRIREMAKSYLESIGEEIPEAVQETELMGKLKTVLKGVRVSTNSEEEMQQGLYVVLKSNFPSIQREYKISKRSRLDFLLEDGGEKIAIECKINATKRADVYRQVKRYVEEGGVTAVVLVAPWSGIASFKVDSTPVIVIDTNSTSI